MAETNYANLVRQAEEASRRERQRDLLASLPGYPSWAPASAIDTVGEFARDVVIPQTPLDFGLMVATAPAGIGGRLGLTAGKRIGAATIGALLDADEAQAGPAGTIARRVRAALTPAERSAPLPNAPFPQYAKEYPPVGPPTPTLDKAKGTTYPAKTPLPEVDAFLKERDRIRAQMQREGYTPYFDPAKRFDVDPARYPMNVDTSTVLPAKMETIDKHLQTIGAPESRKRLQDAYEKGLTLGDPKDWFLMGQLEREYVKELGEKEGRKAFGDRFAAGMAATTAGVDPEANFLLTQYANYTRNKGLPFPEAAHAVPYPIGGGKYGVMGNLRQYRELMDEGGLSALGAENPKRHDFAFDFLGHKRPVMDEQMVSGMTPGMPSAPGKQYGIYSRVASEEAAARGVDPRNFQEVGWAGFRGKEGQPMIGVVNDTIERNHRLTGMPRNEILRGIIRGNIPIYGLGAGVMAPGVIETSPIDQ